MPRFGMLMKDNTPVRRFRGYGDGTNYNVPGTPFTFGRAPRGFGWVDATGGGDDVPGSVPGTTGEESSTNYTDLATSIFNAGAAIVNGVVQATRGSAGQAQCPAGYYYAGNGRCVPVQGAGGGSATPMLLVAGLGLAAVLLLKKS